MVEKSLAETLLDKFHADREKMERYTALVELCPLPAFILAHDAKTIVYVNPAYREMTGRTLEELQDDKWIDLAIYPDDRPSVLQTWRQFAETHKAHPHHHRYISKTGIVTDAVTILERVEGNGYVGFILPKCESAFECPIARLSKLVSPAGL